MNRQRSNNRGGATQFKFKNRDTQILTLLWKRQLFGFIAFFRAKMKTIGTQLNRFHQQSRHFDILQLTALPQLLVNVRFQLMFQRVLAKPAILVESTLMER